MTQTDDELVQFLRDRLNEDEQTARACAGNGEWAAKDIAIYGADLSPEVRAHMARHDPARALAEVAAKREILSLHRRMTKRSTGSGGGTLEDCSLCNHFPAQYPCLTLRLLALPYASHSDYSEAWRP